MAAMEKMDRKRFFKWLWGGMAAAAAGLVGLLLAKDKPKEPSSALLYKVDDYTKVDDALIKFKAAGRLTPNIPNLAALAIGPEGDIYVAGEKELARYGADGKEKARFVLEGRPDCIAVTPDGGILLGMRTRVEVLGADGARKETWEDLGARGYIASIAANETGVYVADAGNRVLLRYDRQGKRLGRFDGKHEANEMAGFVVPSPYFDVAFDPQGALWAVNPGKHGLEQYRENGDLLSAWYRPSMELDGFAGCCNPIHIAFRSDGLLVTLEKGLSRVKVYSPDQKMIAVVAAPDVFGANAQAAACCDLDTPLRDLAVDKNNRVLVAHRDQGAVLIFEQKEKLV